MVHTVLVVGATGSVGKQIVQSLLKKGKEASVRILVRKEKRSQVSDLEKHGVDVVEGDLKDVESLKIACKGVDTVVSAVQGGPDVIIEGQGNLLNAALAAGAKRFYPSDFSYDTDQIPEGTNFNTDIRKKFNEILEKSGIQYVSVRCGVFAEVLNGWFGQFNFLGVSFPDQNKFVHWGDSSVLIDFTTIEDTANFVVESIFDKEVPKKLNVLGEAVSFASWVRLVEELTGKKCTVERRGDIEDLRQLIKDTRAKDPSNFLAYLPLMYLVSTFNGEGKLKFNHADRYPNVKKTSLREHISANLDKFKK